MAEIVVSSLLQILGPSVVHGIRTLGSLTVQEIRLLKSVGDEIRGIKDEFSSMQALLKDADAKEDGDERVKEWLKQVREVACETVDVLDEFRHLQLRQSMVHFFSNWKKKRQLAKRIKAIKSKVSETASRKDNYGLNKWEQGSTSQTTDVKEKRDPRNDALFIEEAQLVGIDDSRNKLVQWLVNGDQQRSVYSVYGQYGLGKTTLVKKAFDNQSVMKHFPYRAWVTVSETFEIKKLLIDLIQQIHNEKDKKEASLTGEETSEGGREDPPFPLRCMPPIFCTGDRPLDKKDENDKKEELKDMDTNKLKAKLQNVLKGKRYILVFDDIWRLEAWSELKIAFPNDIERGSRIIVTTRFYSIAQECTSESKYSLVFELPLLTTDDAFKLFCKVAFPLNDSNCCPPSLVEISQNFVKKCKGLPLAIVSVAGLLRIKKHAAEWNQVYDNLGELMMRSKSNCQLEDLKCIILLSYRDLPSHLKVCLLYLCIFPEDYSIRRRQLLQLWVAEGFVEIKGMSADMTMEDIAMGYLDELINRCLVQVESFGVSGRVKTCRVHDILRDFIVAKAEEQGFVTHFDRKGLHDSQVIGRRLSCLEDTENVFNLLEEKESLFSNLWSFISFDHRYCFSRRARKIISRFKLLRVLKVEAYDYDYKRGIFTRRAITWHKLSHLRYLCLGRLNGQRLILGISHGRFTDLEVLEAKGITIRRNELKEIFKLKRLRYLSVGYLHLSAVGIEKLSNLEHLSVVDVSGPESCGVLKGLGMLTQMRKLNVQELKEEDGIHLCTSIQKMKYLRSLVLSSSSRLHLHSLRLPPQTLEKIYLGGDMDTFPLWFSILPSLIKLTLSGCYIRDESLLKSLQYLPCLAKLRLWHYAFVGEELYFEKGGFASLKELEFESLPNMKKMTVEEGAMPLLEKFSFHGCEQLQNAPLGIKYLTALKTIYMPKRFIDEIRKVWKTGHGPLVVLEE